MARKNPNLNYFYTVELPSSADGAEKPPALGLKHTSIKHHSQFFLVFRMIFQWLSNFRDDTASLKI